jgi:hypothetical protein
MRVKADFSYSRGHAAAQKNVHRSLGDAYCFSTIIERSFVELQLLLLHQAYYRTLKKITSLVREHLEQADQAEHHHVHDSYNTRYIRLRKRIRFRLVAKWE